MDIFTVENSSSQNTLMKKGREGIPGGLVVRILGFHCRGKGSIPGQGTEIPQTAQLGQKKKKRGREGERRQEYHQEEITKE